MSVTIFPTHVNHIPPNRNVECWACLIINPDDEEKNEELEDCSVCKGTKILSEKDLPEHNMANETCHAIFRLLGIQWDYVGTIYNKEIGNVRQRILKLLNSPKARKSELREGYVSTNIVYGGIDDERIVRHLTEINQILHYCQEHNEDVIWG